MGIEKRTTETGKVSYRARLRLHGRGESSSTHVRLTGARAWEAKTLTATESEHWSAMVAGQLRTFAEAEQRYLALLPAMKLKDERNRRRQVEWWQGAIGLCADVRSVDLSAKY